jgi:uncharacterized protein YyaL (SSP411 family)
MAYVCGGLQCLPPVTTLADLEKELVMTEATVP